MTDAANGTSAMPIRKRMFSHTKVRFTRRTKWKTWWWANQYTPRTMKLMTNVANRDRRSNRPCAKPPGPSVSGARSSSTRIVIAIANTPSTSVSRRFFGSPGAVGLPDSVVLPLGRHVGPELKTSVLADGQRLLRRGIADRPHRGRPRVDEARVRVWRVRPIEREASFLRERTRFDVHGG